MMTQTHDPPSNCAVSFPDNSKKDSIPVENALDIKEAAILDIENIFSLTSLKDDMLSLEDKECMEEVASPKPKRESKKADCFCHILHQTFFRYFLQ